MQFSNIKSLQKRLAIAVLSAQCVLGIQQTYADALQDLLHILEPIQGFSAQFSQDTFNAQQVVQQHNEGELVAQTPNHFYWKTVEPFPQEIITDGKTLWVYDPDLQQVTIKPFDENYARTPAMLFAGNAQHIAEQFSVEKISDKPLTFRLLPKTGQKDLFVSMDMTFENSQPVSMIINDAMQQKSVLNFSHVSINPDTKPDKFSFIAPAGVDVLKAK